MRRREFLKFGAAAAIASAAPTTWLFGGFDAAAAATRLDGTQYAHKFRLPLRRPPRVKVSTGKTVYVDMVQFQQQVLQGYPATKLYGYAADGQAPGWPGPTLVADSGVAASIRFRNLLPKGTGNLATSHLLPVDGSVHTARVGRSLRNGAIPTVPHLHGGHTQWQSDGHPDAWFTQNFSQKGPLWQKATYSFANSQPATTLWYHDHTLGLTRLNVYAGLAGAYFVRDANELDLMARSVLPRQAYEMELVLQDRAFTSDGQLFLPTVTNPAKGIDRALYGDFMLVNGTPWPLLDVEPRKYRFRLVNGSDSRIYVLELANKAPFLQVGTDLGLRESACATARIVLGPGERCDVVVDFAPFAGTQFTLRNFGVDGPMSGFRDTDGNTTNNPADLAFGTQGTSANPLSTGHVMRFRVATSRSSIKDARIADGTPLGGTFPNPAPTSTRQLVTYNGRDSFDRFYEMLGTLDGGTMQWMDPPTETPQLGTTEVWEIYNTGPVVHPLHLHLVNFRVLDRQRFTFTATPKPMTDHHGNPVTGATIGNVVKRGTARAPERYEEGRKDTTLCYPGEVTRIVATFDRPGNYVWHCHVLHHEDHDMMRPLIVS
jgi:spore coat protein A